MSGLGRHILLAEQEPSFDQTGIDFVAVDGADHARVYVYFVIDPLDPDLDFAANELDVECRGATTREPRIVDAQSFEAHTDARGRTRNVLAVVFDSGASFEMQHLRLADLTGARLDPFSSAARFSFKQACPTVFDCACHGVPDKRPGADYPVDYLARDFQSYLDAFATFSRERYPQWQMNIVPDQARMLGDLIAAIGDELAFLQDGYYLQTQFDHLTERRSFRQIARILGYSLRPELPAQGHAVLRHYQGTRPAGLAAFEQEVIAGTALAGYGDSDMVIPFEVGASFDDILAGTAYPTHALWTDIPVHIPDENCPWIARGARELTVAGTDLIHPEIGPGTKVLIETRPVEQSEPLRRTIVTLDEDPELVEDALIGTDVTRLHWQAGDALPFDLKLERAFVSANIVPVVSGLTYKERFTIGESGQDLPTAIEREGPLSGTEGTRPVIYRFPMVRTAADGLSWRPAEGDMPWDRRYAPDVALTRTDAAGVVLEDWRVVADLLAEGPTDEAATVEAGHWGPVFSWLDGGLRRQYRDYIGDPGWCLRFGANGFGLTPADGSFFTLRYRTAWAAHANLPPDRMRLLADQPEEAPDSLPMPNAILSASNPLAFDNAQPPEPLALARLTVPHATKAMKLRAVRDSDYEALVSARDDIDATVARSYWLGTWTGTFLATDPKDSVALDDDLRAEVTRFLEEIRLVGRPAYLTGAALRPLDLQIVLCHDPRIPWGNVVEAVLAALAADDPEALFHPANLTFGSRLYRAALEARIAAQRGVTRILRIRYRWRGEGDFKDFTESFLESAPDQIPVLKHDPLRPDLGRLEIFEAELPQETAP
ncbi:hypothetical protein [Halomonas stenophila]|uniref:Baseplate protein J-like domain-containing protein n=1 Tax=Halomonas stenophila TaxID=795312 RepID=A0A7W5HM21_9GAMM|nr:hypothetical protein [Halomonas stenophila]MBB3232256.1 hypothetical protein [Halomonas stenophila]